MKAIHVFFGFLGANMFLWLFIFGLSALVGAFAWPYTINEWLAFAGRPVSVETRHGALIWATGLWPGVPARSGNHMDCHAVLGELIGCRA